MKSDPLPSERALQQIRELEVKAKLTAPDGGVFVASPVIYKGRVFVGSNRGHLYAFRSACWYSWPEQIKSMERLLDYRFEWVLPGHGRPVNLPAGEMRQSLERCVEWMKAR